MTHAWNRATPAVSQALNAEPAELRLIRTVIAERGLGRERVLSAKGRGEPAERWLAGDGGPDNLLSRYPRRL